MTELILLLLGVVVGFWFGKWWEGRWWMDRIDPSRKEWRL
jgi:hypothetical protein